METGGENSKPLSEDLAKKESPEDEAQVKKTPKRRGRRKKAETAPKEQAAQKSPKKKSGITCELPVYLL